MDFLPEMFREIFSKVVKFFLDIS